MYAAAFGHREIVLLILAAFRQLHHVAFQGQRNGQGLTAWQLADKNGHEDIAALLKVETGVFPRPSGPSTFVPAHPLDLDRPPTPTETRSIRSSSIRRNKPCGKVHAAPSAGPGPTDPLPPPSQILHCNDCHRVVAPRRKRSIRASLEADGTFKREKGARVCVCSEAEDSEAEDVLGRDASAKWDVQDTKIPPSRTSSSHNTEIGLTTDHHTNKGATVQSGVHTSRVGVAGLSSTYTGKGAIGLASDNTFKGATGLITGPISKGVTGLSSGNASKDASGLISNLTTKSVTGVSSTRLPKDTTEVSSGSVTKASADESSDNCPTASARGARGLGVRSIIGWGKNLDFAERRRSEGEAGDRSRARSEPVRIGPPDQEERRVLEELMRGLNVSCSPGSGNEADTESLMECERPAVEGDETTLDLLRMSGNNAGSSSSSSARKITMSGVAVGAAQPMPRIGLSASTRSLNRSIQHLVQEDVENRPEHRPPTPARPSLPTLLPGRLLDVSLSASLSSTKSEGRNAPPSRRVTFTAFPRSSSEPRSLTTSPRPQDDDEADDDTPTDLLDASTRSEGWDHLRGARGRGPTFTTSSEGHVVPLPPINRPRYSEAGSKGRSNVRGRGGGPGGPEENVLSVAKKTLEQLETVLAPKETAALPRTIPRTRTSHQIHLET
ncbi:uncharacterized protein [Panulirus ornatus]